MAGHALILKHGSLPGGTSSESRSKTPDWPFSVQDNSKHSVPHGQGSPALEGAEPTGKSVRLDTQASSVELLTQTTVWAVGQGICMSTKP